MIPAAFPDPPVPPPATVPITDQAWYDYHVDLRRWLANLAAALKG